MHVREGREGMNELDIAGEVTTLNQRPAKNPTSANRRRNE
jgi:hypothetical protein